MPSAAHSAITQLGYSCVFQMGDATVLQPQGAPRPLHRRGSRFGIEEPGADRRGTGQAYGPAVRGVARSSDTGSARFPKKRSAGRHTATLQRAEDAVSRRSHAGKSGREASQIGAAYPRPSASVRRGVSNGQWAVAASNSQALEMNGAP